MLLLNEAECCQAKVDNTIQDLHNSLDYTIAKSNNVFYYSFTTIILTLKTCLLTLINVPQQIQDTKRLPSPAVILSILLYFLFGKRLNFSAIFSSCTKTAEQTQPLSQRCSVAMPFSGEILQFCRLFVGCRKCGPNVVIASLLWRISKGIWANQNQKYFKWIIFIVMFVRRWDSAVLSSFCWIRKCVPNLVIAS